ncbi:hypothetical protein KVR01_009273 [Diaporthe batatas]|uniref:uncharacterized protein n=1 Tax=Diaporthe batatas TaxID=748121 RepID=UPI001D039723|nr:uncharacterized protein KVR01_009273 [Diaporthe batatas]KAG8161009.1 hypothetical protein KVR01_009273 [Diaporthe batatas]
MSTASMSQPAPLIETNKCGPFTGKSPETSVIWDRFVEEYLINRATNELEPELRIGSNHIRLCGLRRWKAGKEEPKGSAMNIEHFLHLRALVQNHVKEPLPIQELVDLKYLHAAEEFLKEWPEFENYIDQVPIIDPAVDVDSLGLFAGAKTMQNQVLLDAYLNVAQDDADSFDESVSETPLKKGRYNTNFYGKPPDNDAADEQIVNESLISYASALTRRWMIEKTAASPSGADQTPSKGAIPTHDWITIADWTMSRDRFYIQERVRDNDATQDSHMAGLKPTARNVGDGHSYGRILTSETDGSLYRVGPNSTETLAIVECKKRLRTKNMVKIEWQEAAEVVAWLNLRLRTESEDRNLQGGGSLSPRRGVLKPKPAYKSSAEKSRCLLLAQDREEIHIIIGEWDAMYEEYIIEGKLSKTNIDKLDQLRAAKDPAPSVVLSFFSKELSSRLHTASPSARRAVLPRVHLWLQLRASPRSSGHLRISAGASKAAVGDIGDTQGPAAEPPRGISTKGGEQQDAVNLYQKLFLFGKTGSDAE